ncbi:hypothetical protein AVEN_182146-1 [Araneus ventricosus]|uniref:Uncharacterized protein n=1 Tax=Araneus ventricosus TaxID=182803 RepID=A0A4Y2GST6_ARAVE|nr:hypothetical protein AVEN_182146-1 [Araneus ventricosus]
MRVRSPARMNLKFCHNLLSNRTTNLSAYLAERFNPCHGNLCDNPLPLSTTRFPKPFRQAFFAIWDRSRLHHSDICACGEKEDPLHYATSCHMTLSFHFTKPSAENTQLLWKSVLSNKLSRINIAKLISFLTENENLIKRPPDTTSSSDSDPDFSLSPRPQTYGLRPSRGSILWALFSPPTSI